MKTIKESKKISKKILKRMLMRYSSNFSNHSLKCHLMVLVMSNLSIVSKQA